MKQQESLLTALDRLKIDSLTKRFQKRELDAQQAYLDEVRDLLNADYVVRVVGQTNIETGRTAVLEFGDSANLMCGVTEEPWRSWLSIGMKLNVADETGQFFAALTKDEPHVTVRLEDLKPAALRWDLRGLVARAYALVLLKQWHGAGLYDEMYNCYKYEQRGNLIYGSVLGLHRLRGRKPFDMHDQELLHTACSGNKWIHAIGANADFDATALPSQYRELFPLLLRHYSQVDIGKILGRSHRTLEKQIPAIAAAMKLEPATRDAIQEHYRYRPPVPGSNRSALEDLSKGLASLRPPGGRPAE